VIEALGLAVGELGAIHNGGMVQFVQVDHIPTADQAGDQSQVGRVPGGEDQARFLTQEFGQGALQLLVQVQGSIEKPAAGTARAVAGQRSRGRRQYLWMMRKSQVIVRPQHDPLLTVNNNDGILRLGDRIEVRIQPDGLQLARFGKLTALLEQRDLLELLGVHGTSSREEVRIPHIIMSRNGLN
jgi:hypothetical protein